jgi:hypothetical protein
MTTTHRRRVELGRMGLASDAAERRIHADCCRHGIALDMTARATQAHRRLHSNRARERIEHDALFGLLDDSEFLPLLRFAYDEAGLRHGEEPGGCDDWFKVAEAIEELVSALDDALAADAARDAGRAA